MPKIDDNIRDQICEQYDAGRTQVDIAAEFNVHRKTVYDILKMHGFIPARQLVTQREMALVDICNTYKLTPQKLRKMCRQVQGGP